MNVFILDRDMIKSAKMLDDAHLNAQINEACQILMANYNKECYPNAKIGHVNHPVTKFYANDEAADELLAYTHFLCCEYLSRKGKEHQNWFWVIGFEGCFPCHNFTGLTFRVSKTYVNGIMTDDIQVIRKYISTKPQQKNPVWTGRDKPEWWEV